MFKVALGAGGAMLDLNHCLRVFGTLNTGGAIGGLLAYLLFETYFQGISFHVVVGLCVTLGASVQRILQRAGGFLAFFEQLFELGKLKKRGIIKEEKYQQIIDELVERRFLGTNF